MSLSLLALILLGLVLVAAVAGVVALVVAFSSRKRE
jgi:hypothetical protein